MNLADPESLPIGEMIRAAFYLSSIALQPAHRSFKMFRLIHFLIHKNAQHSVKIHQLVFDQETKLLITLRLVNFMRFGLSEEVSSKEVEKEILQICRCLYRRRAVN